MKEFIRKWSNWWILNPKRKQLDDAFEKELNELIEREVALRIHDVVGRGEQLKAFVDWWHGLSQEELAWYEGRYVEVFLNLTYGTNFK